jgi:Ankyrin repeats (many copies)
VEIDFRKQKMNILYTRLIVMLAATSVPLQADPPSDAQTNNDESLTQTSKIPPIQETVDAHLCRNLYWMLDDNNRAEFISLVNFLHSTGSKSDLYVDVLFKAAAHPDPLYLLVLIKAGLVDVNLHNEHGYSVGVCVFSVPLKRRTEPRDRLRLLMQCGYKPKLPELLVEAATHNSTEIVLELEKIFTGKIDGKLEVNVSNSGTTPLIEAVKAGSMECVGIFIARNADLYARDSQGKTAVDYAKQDWPIPSNPRLPLQDSSAARLEIRRLILEKAGKVKSNSK